MNKTAYRRKRKIKPGKKNAKSSFKLILWFVFVLLAALLVYLMGNIRLFKGENKLTLVANSSSGEIYISTFDPANGEISSFVIPGDTQLEVSRNLGKWKAKSLWQLGVNERLGGKLLRESIVANFNLPVVAWADKGVLGFIEGGIVNNFQAVFLPYKSNLSFGDKLKLALFSLRVGEVKRTVVNLEETALLKETELEDGEEGYIVSGDLPNSLRLIFSDPKVSSANLKVSIKDGTSSYGLAENVGKTVEVLGAKVAVIDKDERENHDCSVMGNDAYLVEKASQIFSCKIDKKAGESSFDLELILGDDFSKRF